ncbi:MAG: hypothetical protein AB7F88_13525 [Pyrinomonadaceae bacterium]
MRRNHDRSPVGTAERFAMYVVFFIRPYGTRSIILDLPSDESLGYYHPVRVADGD